MPIVSLSGRKLPFAPIYLRLCWLRADLKRRTEEELEKRSWSKALANLNTVELADLSEAIGDKLEVRHQRSAFQGRGTIGGGPVNNKPCTPPVESRGRKPR